MRRPSESRSMSRLERPCGSRTSSPAGFSGLERPSSRAGSIWKTRNDGADIAAAMAAVTRVMKSKSGFVGADERGRAEASPVNVVPGAAFRDAVHLDTEVIGSGDASDDSGRMRSSRSMWGERHGIARDISPAMIAAEERLRASEKSLRAAMDHRSLVALRAAIDDATAAGVPAAIVNEARALWRLENRLQVSISEDDLSNVRKAVAEVERGKTLADFPREPPFVEKQQLQYWSDRRGDWVDCRVVEVSAEGKILINLKKKATHWYSVKEQLEKFRITDADVAAAAPKVRLDDALYLLDKADALESALESEDVGAICSAIADAGHDRPLQELVAKAEAFLHEAAEKRKARLKASFAMSGSETEPVFSSTVAAAWYNAKKNIWRALRDEADRAIAEAAGKGWGNLEQDLAIERLTALEEAFDATDIAGLESAVDQLASTDFELDMEVVDDARLALRGIAGQHEELREAIRNGDVNAIQVGLKLAEEHFVPPSLVRFARLTMEIAVTLDTAVKNQDWSLLANALSRAERENCDMHFVQRARGVAQAIEALQDAMRRNDVDAIDQAIRDAEVKGVPLSLVCQARQHRAKEVLQAALTSNDPAAIEEAMRAAEAAGVPSEVLAHARLEQATNALHFARNSGDLKSIEEAIRAAEAAGVSAAAISQAKQERAALARVNDALQAAMQSRDPAAIEKAIRDGKAAGIPIEVLEQARQDRATEALREAMRSGGLDDIEEMIRVAEGVGVPTELLQQARQEKARKEEEQRQAEERKRLEEERQRLEEEQRAREEEERRLEEARKKKEQLLADLHKLALSGDVDAMRDAIVKGEAVGLDEELAALRKAFAEAEAKRKRELLIRDAPKIAVSGDTSALRTAIADCEEVGLVDEPALLKKALEEELARRMEKALKERSMLEKLAAEFKSAKEAQDFGGAVQAAQWRAAVSAVAKPFVFSEED